MKYKNLLAVLLTLFFSSSIVFSQYTRTVVKSLEEIANNRTNQTASVRLNKTLSLDTFYVPTDYELIQDAIDAADSGDIVIINEGTYYQQFNFKGKALSVGSEYLIDDDTSHISKTIIDGSALSASDSLSLVYLINGEDSTSSLIGLTLTGGRGTFEPQYNSISGGAVYINNSGAAISHNIIEGNSIVTDKHAYSGGLNCNLGANKTLIITDNTISNNSVKSKSSDKSASGGGIGVYALGESAKVEISRNRITFNKTNSINFNISGGIYFDGNDQPNFQGTINSNLISHNTVFYRSGVESYGGGMSVINANAIIANNIIVYNSSHEAAGIDNANISGKTNPKYVNNAICFNTAINEEGGISTFHIGEMENCIIWGNTPDQVTPWSQKMKITYSNVEGGYPGEGNINLDPLFCNTEYCVLTEDDSPCIDTGNPDASYNDFGLSSPEYPAFGTFRNDMGAFGGPNSQWWKDQMQLWEPCSEYIYVPTDYIIIQDAIDAAGPGDVVIIEEGTYTQQFNFKGKAITVGSEYLIDDDTSHISNTVIDGMFLADQDTASLVSFMSGEDSNSVLCGLTLQNGSGTYLIGTDGNTKFRFGGAIAMGESGGKIINNIFKNNSILEASLNFVTGGAIDCFALPEDKTIIIENNYFSNNSTKGQNSWGGAINCEAISGTLNIDKNIVTDNSVNGSSQGNGGGICIIEGLGAQINISNNYVNNNVVRGGGDDGGGIFAMNCKVDIFNNIVTENSCYGSSHGRGGGISVGNWGISNPAISIANIKNNSIIDNYAQSRGSGIYVNSMPVSIINNIIRNNTAPARGQIIINGSYEKKVQYSNIEGGYEGEGNIDVDPMFCDSTYCLLTAIESPCIDAGNPDPLYNDREADPFYPARGTLRNDMGAFGGPHSKWSEMSILPADPTVSVKGNFDILPDNYSLSQNYPNPFNPSTTIKYAIPAELKSKKSKLKSVTLKIFDLLGREITTLVNQKQKPGNYTVNWDAVNYPSGVYFYELKAGKYFKTKKMLLIK